VDAVVWFSELDASATRALTDGWLQRLAAEVKGRHGIEVLCAPGTAEAVWSAHCRALASGREVARQLEAAVRKPLLAALHARPQDATRATLAHGAEGTTVSWG
jgi:ATP-dependent Clp protease ATP-binding subunit ClpA